MENHGIVVATRHKRARETVAAGATGKSVKVLPSADAIAEMMHAFSR